MLLAANAISVVLIKHTKHYDSTFTVGEYMLLLAEPPLIS
jgi:hypothetical protein